MGTNYYALKKPTKAEKKKIIKLIEEDKYGEAQSLFPEEIHIGKSSRGWMFCFNHNDEEYYKKNRDSIAKFLERHELISEYKEVISVADFWELVDSKKDGLTSDSCKEQRKAKGEHIPSWEYGKKSDEITGGLRFSTSTEFF